MSLEDLAIKVDAYSGSSGEQQPRWLIVNGERWEVLIVIDQWLEPNGRHFKIRAADGCFYHLRYDLNEEYWVCVQRWMLDA